MPRRETWRTKAIIRSIPNSLMDFGVLLPEKCSRSFRIEAVVLR